MTICGPLWMICNCALNIFQNTRNFSLSNARCVFWWIFKVLTKKKRAVKMSIEIKNGQKSSWISCGMLCGFTHAVHQKYQHIGREWKNEWTFFMMERGLYTTYSRIRSIDGHGSSSRKNPRQINNSSRTIYLAGKKSRNIQKKSRNSFFLPKAKIIFFWFGLLVSFLLLRLLDGKNFRGYECFIVEIGEIRRMIKTNQVLNKYNSFNIIRELHEKMVPKGKALCLWTLSFIFQQNTLKIL